MNLHVIQEMWDTNPKDRRVLGEAELRPAPDVAMAKEIPGAAAKSLVLSTAGIFLLTPYFMLIWAAAIESEVLAEAGVALLIAPVALCVYWTRGYGAVVAGLGSLFSVIPLYSSFHLVALPMVVSTSVALVAVAFVVYWSVEQERRASAIIGQQGRVLERRHALSLELLAATRDGRFVEANSAWKRKLGHEPRTLLGRDFLDFVHPEDRAQVTRSRYELSAGLDVTAQSSRFQHADGSWRWIEWSARHDPKDDRNYIAGRDITSRRAAEKALRQHQEKLEQAVAERTLDLERRTRELERVSHDLEAARRDNLRRLAIVAEFHDEDTAQHTERVGTLAAKTARALGLDEHEVALIRDAAPLHDIGKVGIADSVLLNTGEFTGEERRAMQQHTEIGYTILAGSNTPALALGAEIALCHHEWWDGSGYPRGARETEIPIAARIVAVVDVFDALTHVRPYKKAWPVEDALGEIRRLSGSQFDPNIVTAFERVISTEPHSLPTESSCLPDQVTVDGSSRPNATPTTTRPVLD